MQTRPEPIGATVDAIRDALSWVGKCNRTQAGHSMHLVFKFAPEFDPQSTLKLKVEINTREHASLNGTVLYPFTVESDWYQGKAEITSFTPDELFGTKLRALLQRNSPGRGFGADMGRVVDVTSRASLSDSQTDIRAPFKNVKGDSALQGQEIIEWE